MSSAKSERHAWHRSIGWRLTAWYFLVFVASTLLIGAAAVVRIQSSIHQQIVATVHADLDAHRVAFESEGIAGLQKLYDLPDPLSRSLYVRIVDGADVTLFEHRSSAAAAFDPQTLGPKSAHEAVHAVRVPTDGSLWSVAATPLSQGRWLQIAISDEQTREVVGHLRSGLLAAAIGAILVGLVGGFILVRRALGPLQQLAATARQVIASGDLSLRVPQGATTDELDELARLFNGMLARNQTLVRGMREALDNVAHDLRTPLTRLRTGAEVALADTADPARIRDALADTIEESDRVLAMLTTLMDISEAEAGVMKLARAPVDLSALGREAAELYQHVADERAVRLVTHFTQAVVPADPHRMRRVFANLLDNAIKYSSVGGQVDISTAHDESWATFSVRDQGAGIPVDDQERIWERLYRADHSRSERGLGLGLSFVKAIVEAHGGRAEVTSAPGAGSTFTIYLPKRPRASDHG